MKILLISFGVVVIGLAVYVCYWLYIVRACPLWWFNFIP